jgi:hypothetical protein
MPGATAGRRVGVTVRGAVVALGFVASACGSQQSPVARTRPAPSPVRWHTGDPARLVGSWHVSAPGEESGAILTIGDRLDGGLLLFRRCGMFSGGWRANAVGMFVGSLDGGDSACYPLVGTPAWPWLDRAVGFRRAGGTVLLVDRLGETVARLTPGAHPHTGPDDSAEFAAPPVVTPAMRRGFATPAPLPPGVRPATATAIQGRWVPADRPSSPHWRPYVAFRPDGRYGGSDGCNGVGGRYAIGPAGVVLATEGPSTAVGCENSALPSWPAQSGRLGLRAGRLVFVDPSGRVLGEAVRPGSVAVR